VPGALAARPALKAGAAYLYYIRSHGRSMRRRTRGRTRDRDGRGFRPLRHRVL